MSISADLIILKPLTEEEFLIESKFNPSVLNIKEFFISSKIIEEYFNKYNTYFFKEKIICHIGSSYSFKDNILDNYEENIGILKLKDNIDKLNNDTFDILKDFLLNKYKIDWEYILEIDFYINLNY